MYKSATPLQSNRHSKARPIKKCSPKAAPNYQLKNYRLALSHFQHTHLTRAEFTLGIIQGHFKGFYFL